MNADDADQDRLINLPILIRVIRVHLPMQIERQYSLAHFQESCLKYLSVNSIGQCRIDFLEQAVLCERRVLASHLKIRTGQIQMNLTNLRIQRGSMLES